MNKEELYALLDLKGIAYEITEHDAVYNMEDLAKVKLLYPEADAKNLFVRDDKKKQYYLITVKGDKRVNLKDFQNANGTRRLSFGSAEDLLAILGLTPGSVSPFGLLNDAERKTAFYLDSYFLNECELIGCHPNDNTATVWIKVSDLVNLIKEHGTKVFYTDL